MRFSDKQKKIVAKAEKKQVKAIVKQAKAETQNLCNQMTKIVKNSFTDTVYAKAISNVKIERVGTDIEYLKDKLEDYELDNNTDVLVYADIRFNDNVYASVQAWVTVEDDMKINKGDFRIASENCEIDHDGLIPNKASFISDCLDTLQQVEDNEPNEEN